MPGRVVSDCLILLSAGYCGNVIDASANDPATLAREINSG